MSVGFENSALKMSFSLSSLPPSSGTLENTEHVRLRAERPYHSLTKKPRRDPEKDSWRHSWGSRDENKDEFWAALQPNYNYIMDNNLIDSCKEANGELSWDDEDMAANYTWTLNELIDQFSELYSWLNSIQEAVYGKGGIVVDKNFKTSYIEDVQRKNYRRKLFNEQAGKLLSKYPDSRDDISRHVSHLNAKWELIEQLLSSGKDSLDKNIPYIDVQHEIRCLRKWIRHMESTLQPLDFRTGQTWSLQEIEEKAKEHLALQRDISAQGRVVSLVVRLAPAAKVARHLERRWHHLYLRALEWQCHVEALAARVRSPGPTGSCSESDEEPAPKQPRLTGSGDVTDEGSYFEDDLDDLCVMEEPPRRNGDGETDAAPGSQGDAVDCSSFNKSDWTANNYGTFYFKHLDTDSDHGRSRNADRKESAGSLDEPKSVDDSSEDDGWTYTAGSPTSKQNRRSDSSTCDSVVAKNACSVPKLEFGSSGSETGKTHFPEKEDAKQIKYSPMRRSSKDLPRQRGNSARVFEPLVFDTIGPQTKCARTKEWLQKHLSGGKLQPMDSCDASGEYTTGDSDDEKHSESSEDLNGSVATFRQVDVAPGEGSRSASVECFPDNEATPTAEKLPPSGPVSPEQGNVKVVMRNKQRQMSAERPWSVSGISQICRQAVLVERDPLAQLSFSESAINEIVTSPPRSKTKSFVGFSSVVDRNVSSSTIEEATLHLAEGSGSRNGSLRRRRFKLRKRGVVRKSESGSDGQKSVMVKSGSFSGTSAAPAKLHERSSVSESAVARHSSAEDESLLQLPIFQLGPIDHIDSDIDKASTQGTEEQLSSFSEQAWDNYQEKYMSEPYSEELADMETARRLLEFGDDYRNYLDSQSDCSWGVGGNDSASSLRRRKPPVPTEESSLLDSDSDMEDIQHAICLSQAQLEYTEKVIHDQIHKASPVLVLATDYAEIAATCSENIRCLNVISEKGQLLPPKKMMEMKGWLERWETLHSTAEELQRVRSLQREMTALREEMTALAARVCTVSGDLKDRDQLEKIIQQVKAELSALRERKAALLKVNVAVHRYHPARLLKEDVAELYRVWDEALQRTSQQLHALQRAALAWQQFDASLEELQGLLRGDRGALRMLDAALRGGALRPDVARVLSEKQEALCRSPLSSQLSEHGSLSDSGISDSGSEHELCERERRLAALRGLARHLAASLPAGSAALAGVARQMELAEVTLRNLQKSCRDLLMHAADDKPQPTAPRPRRRRPASGESRPWLWRVVRAALPFQMALVALFCVACLLEPHCCDAINNLTLSLTPQLLYTNGPPPT